MEKQEATEKYEMPEIELIYFSTEDVVTASKGGCRETSIIDPF